MNAEVQEEELKKVSEEQKHIKVKKHISKEKNPKITFWDFFNLLNLFLRIFAPKIWGNNNQFFREIKIKIYIICQK